MELLRPGQTLNERHYILRIIRSGAMGSVYEARDERLDGVSCAVKEMSELGKGGIEDDELVLRRFKEERAVLARLRHPGIPQVKDFFQFEKASYIVMDFIDGANLEEELENYLALTGGPYPAEILVPEVLQILDVLVYLHGQKPPIIHRDIKPANLVRGLKSGRVSLVDFGLARSLGPNSLQTAVGTLAYCSLEQVQGRASTQSDIYSLGVTMAHLLSGLIPTPFAPAPLQSIAPFIDSKLASIIDRTYSSDGAARILDAQTLRTELQSWLNREKSVDVIVMRQEQTVTVQGNAPDKPSQAASRSTQRSQSKLWLYALAALALALPFGVITGRYLSTRAASQSVAAVPSSTLVPAPTRLQEGGSPIPLVAVSKVTRDRDFAPKSKVSQASPRLTPYKSPPPSFRQTPVAVVPKQPGASEDYPTRIVAAGSPQKDQLHPTLIEHFEPGADPREDKGPRNSPNQQQSPIATTRPDDRSSQAAATAGALKLQNFDLSLPLPPSCEAILISHNFVAQSEAAIWQIRCGNKAGTLSFRAAKGASTRPRRTRLEAGDLDRPLRPTRAIDGAQYYRIGKDQRTGILLICDGVNEYCIVQLTLAKAPGADALLDEILAGLHYGAASAPAR